MIADARSDKPVVIHRLGVVLRFLDTFTGARVGVPLDVSIPARNWPALRREDTTYRFLVPNRLVPAGLFDVAVAAPGGEYFNWEPFQVQLPPPSLPHAPPLVARDFLVEKPLWPTVHFRPSPGETAVLGRVESSGGATVVAGLKVFLFPWPGPAPVSPYAYSNENGEFLFRLPALKGSVSGTTVVSKADLGIAVRDATNTVVSVTPAGSFAVPLGKVSVLRFTAP
jgi:hypothetical protein